MNSSGRSVRLTAVELREWVDDFERRADGGGGEFRVLEHDGADPAIDSALVVVDLPVLGGAYLIREWKHSPEWTITFEPDLGQTEFDDDGMRDLAGRMNRIADLAADLRGRVITRLDAAGESYGSRSDRRGPD